MKEYVYGKKAIISFFVVVIILSAIIDVLYLKGAGDYLVFILMWIPALAALISNIINVIDKKEKISFKQFLNRMGFRSTSIIYIVMGTIIPFIYLIVSYELYWKMYPNNYAYTGVPVNVVLKDCFLYSIISVLSGLISATGEEIGWRGFILPALKERLGLKKATIIVSGFWCLWHFPLLIWGDYMSGTPLWYSLIAFVLCIFPVGVICSLLSNEAKSMWPCAFLHASHNGFDQAVFGFLTRGENKMYFVSETGIFTIICTSIIMFLMLDRARKEKIIDEK